MKEDVHARCSPSAVMVQGCPDPRPRPGDSPMQRNILLTRPVLVCLNHVLAVNWHRSLPRHPPPPGSKACAFQHEGLRIDIRALVPFVDTGWMVRGKQAGMQVMFRVCLNFLLQHACPLQNPLQGPCLLCTHWHRWWSRSMMFLRVSGRRPANSCTSTKVCTRSTAGRGWRL